MEGFDIHLFEENYHKGKCRFELGGNAIIMSEWKNYYETLIEPLSESAMICIQKLYYNDTLALMKEGKYLKLGSTKIGVWKEYDEEGELVKEIDYDTGWNVDWETIFSHLLMLGFDVKKIVRISRIVEVEMEDGIQKYLSSDYIKDNVADKVGDKEVFRTWRITVLLSPEVNQVILFDGGTGNKLWSEYELKER